MGPDGIEIEVECSEEDICTIRGIKFCPMCGRDLTKRKINYIVKYGK